MKKRQDKNCSNSSYRREEKNKLQEEMAEENEMKSRAFCPGGRYFQMISKSYQVNEMFFEKKLKI